MSMTVRGYQVRARVETERASNAKRPMNNQKHPT